MRLTSEQHGECTVVRVEETRIDAGLSVAFKDWFMGLAGQSGGPVILDLSKVEFVDSSGLGAIVAARKILSPSRPLELAGLSPLVARVFELTRMDRVFTIHPDLRTALTAHAA